MINLVDMNNFCKFLLVGQKSSWFISTLVFACLAYFGDYAFMKYVLGFLTLLKHVFK